MPVASPAFVELRRRVLASIRAESLKLAQLDGLERHSLEPAETRGGCGHPDG